MPRRLSIIALLAAWLCASGAMLDGVQVFAWTRMFVRYAQQTTIAEAAAETMDASKPCPICLAVRKARASSNDEAPVVISRNLERVVLLFHEVPPVVFAPEGAPWPHPTQTTAESWSAPVAVPPPRADVLAA